MRVLVADDDAEVRLLLQRSLGRAGHAVDVVGKGDDALWMAGEVAYDAIVLDVNMPTSDGFTVCRQLRENQIWAPVLFLTGRDDVADRVTGLDAGADDYLVKPFSLAELEARLRSITRRRHQARPTTVDVGDLSIDPGARRVTRGGVEIVLTSKEFLLLEYLARHAGEALSRSAVHEQLWDFAFEPRSNVVDALVRRLRAKVDEPFGRSTIQTVRGTGYRLVDDAP
ncbi:MAG: response regulator transcription factor [Acidimicrobiales bacterium]